MRHLAVVAVLALASPAFAQAPGEVAPQGVAQKQKDPAIAVGLSLGVPLAGFVTIMASGSEGGALLGVGAMYLGPATGHWYAGQIGGYGLTARAIAAVSIVHGFSLLDQQGLDCLGLSDSECAAAEARWDDEADRGALFFYGGLALWAGSTIYDAVAARSATQRWNRERAVLTPSVISVAGARVPALTLSGSF